MMADAVEQRQGILVNEHIDNRRYADNTVLSDRAITIQVVKNC